MIVPVLQLGFSTRVFEDLRPKVNRDHVPGSASQDQLRVAFLGSMLI